LSWTKAYGAADYLGNSEAEVRRTYAHLVRERADEIRSAAGSIIHAQERRA